MALMAIMPFFPQRDKKNFLPRILDCGETVVLFGSLKGINDDEDVEEEEVEEEVEEEDGEGEEEVLGSLNGIRELLIVELTVGLLELIGLVELVKVELVKVGVTVEEVITYGLLDTWKMKIISFVSFLNGWLAFLATC